MNKFIFTIIFCLICAPVFAQGNDADTVILLHCNGSDASTTFTDDAVGGSITWAGVDNAQIDTADKKWGTGACLFDGSSDYLNPSTDTEDDMQMAFVGVTTTTDFWMKLDNYTDGCLYGGDNATNNDQQLYVLPGELTFAARAAPGADRSNTVYGNSGFFSTGAWHHVMILSEDNATGIFFNGGQYGQTATTTDSLDVDADWGVGGCYIYDGMYYIDGWIDEFRVQLGDYFGATMSLYEPGDAACDCNSASAQITGCTDTTGITAGMYVNSSVCVKDGQTVVSNDSSSAFTMNANASATSSNRYINVHGGSITVPTEEYSEVVAATGSQVIINMVKKKKFVPIGDGVQGYRRHRWEEDMNGNIISEVIID